ncbi:YvcK family protein [Candidatus Gottesmanbacteria bacterium]|nr:YvcK family protein [Candidatus Gottesmanbacteria bacterium]
MKNIVCIGGGTGTFVALRGLKQYPYRLSAIVSMADSGGSNKRIRDEFGLLPTSDLRQCLVALSDESGGVGLLRKLFMYRFEKGQGISGMTFGNLFMAALSDILGSQAEAIRQTSKVLRIKGSVIPVTFTDANLHAQYENGHQASEEHLIDMPEHDGKLKIKRIWLQPKAKANPEALSAIAQADLIVLGPGDLFTSLLPNLLVDGIAQALKIAKAPKVYVGNLMTKWGQTYNFTAADHVRTLEQYIGRSIDVVLVNTGVIPKKALDFYAKYHEQPVVNDLPSKKGLRVVKADLVNSKLIAKTKADALVRSLIRHDSDKLAKTLVALIS